MYVFYSFAYCLYISVSICVFAKKLQEIKTEKLIKPNAEQDDEGESSNYGLSPKMILL